MHKYLHILRLGWLDALEYRTEFFVSVLGWGVRLFIALYLWFAVAEARGGQIGAYSFRTILSYFFIVQIISSFTFSRVGFEIAYDIYRGDFANFMLKPLRYIPFRLVHEMSKNAFRTGIALLLFGTILMFELGGISFPIWKIPLVLIAIIASYFLNSFIVVTIALTAFWITNSTRLTFIYFGILTIFSGMIIPIDLFPPKLFAIFQYLPFPYIFFFPAKLIQSNELTPFLKSGFIIEWSFIAVLTAILWLTYRRGVRHFEAVGR